MVECRLGAVAWKRAAALFFVCLGVEHALRGLGARLAALRRRGHRLYNGGGVGCGERFFYYFWEVKRKGKDKVCVV